MKKATKNMTSFTDHLNGQYGARGTDVREKYEEEFKALSLRVMIQELGRAECEFNKYL